MPEIYKNGRLYGSGNSGANDYDDLTGHPSINNEEVVGDKTSADYGLASTSDLADKADGAGLTFSVDQRGLVNVTNDNTPTPTYALPAGGTTGQVLKKASDDDDDVEWANDSYSLPTASSSTLGGVKVDGAVFNVDENGYLTQVGGGAGGGHTILDDGIPMGQRGSLDFIDHDLEDNDKDDITIVNPHRLTSEELDEIMSTLPGTPTDLPVLFDESGAEYQVGWYVNSSGLKKPVYKKSVDCGVGPNNATKVVSAGISNLERVLFISGILYSTNPSDVWFKPLPCPDGGSSDVYLDYNTGNVRLTTSANYSNNTQVYIYIYYTKSTDTPQ